MPIARTGATYRPGRGIKINFSFFPLINFIFFVGEIKRNFSRFLPEITLILSVHVQCKFLHCAHDVFILMQLNIQVNILQINNYQSTQVLHENSDLSVQAPN